MARAYRFGKAHFSTVLDQLGWFVHCLKVLVNRSWQAKTMQADEHFQIITRSARRAARRCWDARSRGGSALWPSWRRRHLAVWLELLETATSQSISPPPNTTAEPLIWADLEPPEMFWQQIRPLDLGLIAALSGDPIARDGMMLAIIDGSPELADQVCCVNPPNIDTPAALQSVALLNPQSGQPAPPQRSLAADQLLRAAAWLASPSRQAQLLAVAAWNAWWANQPSVAWALLDLAETRHNQPNLGNLIRAILLAGFQPPIVLCQQAA